jgi:hypothetical protein
MKTINVNGEESICYRITCLNTAQLSELCSNLNMVISFKSVMIHTLYNHSVYYAANVCGKLIGLTKELEIVK